MRKRVRDEGTRTSSPPTPWLSASLPSGRTRRGTACCLALGARGPQDPGPASPRRVCTRVLCRPRPGPRASGPCWGPTPRSLWWSGCRTRLRLRAAERPCYLDWSNMFWTWPCSGRVHEVLPWSLPLSKRPLPQEKKKKHSPSHKGEKKRKNPFLFRGDP